MKRGFLEKVEERLRELEIARKVYFELGGDDEEPAHSLRRVKQRELTLEASRKPLLVVSRGPAVPEDERNERKRQRDHEAYERRKKKKKSHGGESHGTARDIVLKLFLDNGNKPMSSGDIILAWPGKKVLMGSGKQKAYQALHELKKLGLARHNQDDRLYALSEAGLTAARELNSREPGGLPTV